MLSPSCGSGHVVGSMALIFDGCQSFDRKGATVNAIRGLRVGRFARPFWNDGESHKGGTQTFVRSVSVIVFRGVVAITRRWGHP